MKELQEILADLIYQQNLLLELVEDARQKSDLSLWRKRWILLCEISKDIKKVEADIKWYKLRFLIEN